MNEQFDNLFMNGVLGVVGSTCLAYREWWAVPPPGAACVPVTYNLLIQSVPSVRS